MGETVRDAKTSKRTFEFDLNHDGFKDQIRAECNRDNDCRAVQVEVGLPDGGYVSVFKRADASRVEPGTRLVYSPQMFLDSVRKSHGLSLLRAFPGRIIGESADAKQASRLFSSAELFVECARQYGGDSLSRCCDQARREPENHIFQPAVAFNAKIISSDQVLFPDGTTIDRDLVLPEGALALPLENIFAPFLSTPDPTGPDTGDAFLAYKLRAQVAADVRTGRSADPAEYFYAHTIGEIGDGELVDFVSKNWRDFVLSDGVVNFRHVFEVFNVDPIAKKVLIKEHNEPTEVLVDLAVRLWQGSVLASRKRELVDAAMEAIRRRPSILDDHPELLEGFEEAVKSKEGMEEMLNPSSVIFDGSGKLDEVNEPFDAAAIARRQPALLGLVYGMEGNVEKAVRADEKLKSDFPRVGAALAELDASLEGGAEFKKRKARIASTVAAIKRIIDLRPADEIERLANLDKALLVKLVGGDGRTPWRWRETLKGIIDENVSIKMVAADGISSRDLDKMPANAIRKNELMLRLTAQAFSDEHPYEYVMWSLCHVDDLERAQMERNTVRCVEEMARSILLDPENRHVLFARAIDGFYADSLPSNKSCSNLDLAGLVLSLLMGMEWERRLNVDIELPGQESISRPTATKIVEMAQKFPSLRSAVFLALAAINDSAPDEITDDVRAWVKANIAGNLTAEEHMAGVRAAVLLGPEAIPHLMELLNDPDRVIRSAALDGLAKMDRPTTQMIDLFFKAMDDEELQIRLLAANALIEWGVDRVADVLGTRLASYREEISALDSEYGVEDGDASALKLSLRLEEYQERLTVIEGRYGMAQLVADAQGRAELASPTMAGLALYAVSRFGRPPALAPHIKAMLFDSRTDEVDVAFAAQALVTLEGADALPIVFDRIEKQGAWVTADLIEYACSKAAEFGAAHLAPRLFGCLMSEDPAVRKVVASNLASLDNKKTLHALIKNSNHAEAAIRMRMAEALTFFKGHKSESRLRQMLTDPDESVRAAAKASLDRLTLSFSA